MFQGVTPPILRSTYNCNYSIWHFSNCLCYLLLSWRRNFQLRKLAETVWPVPDAVITIICAPEDGWSNHPKHVEQCIVAFCWTITDTKSQLWNWTVSQGIHKRGSALGQGVLTSGQLLLYKLHFRNVKYRFLHIGMLLMKLDIIQIFHNFSTSCTLCMLF
jgi:hypothetical protein